MVVIKCIPQELGFRFSLTEGDRAAVWVLLRCTWAHLQVVSVPHSALAEARTVGVWESPYVVKG